MIKIYDGIPQLFMGMGWSTDLQSIGISIQQILNPFDNSIGLNYKRDGKSKSIVFQEGAAENEEESCILIRKFEIEEFNIPAELSPYAKYLDGK